MIVDPKLIDEAKHKLGDLTPDLIAEELNLEKYDARNHKALCPFHHEKTPSFIYDPKTMRWHCFSCNKTVDVIDVFQYKGATYIESVQKLFDLVGIQYSFGEHKVKTKHQYRYPKEVTCENKDKVYEYLAKRGLSKETVDYLDIRQDEKGNCVFNYYDTNDVLTMVKYRPSHRVDKKSGEIKNWCQKDADTFPLLFNMHRINPSEPILICSGELDCAAAVESGWKNAVSIPLGDGNTHWVESNWDFLEQFNSIIIAADNDDSGRKYRSEIVPRLGSWRCKIVDIPATAISEKTGKEVSVKDVNDFLVLRGKEETYALFVNAKDSPVPSVKNLSNVGGSGFEDIGGVPTGIAPLDKELMRLFWGTLTILTGRPGAGKSSILGQIIANALDTGVNTWLFSGELPDFMTKNWITYVLAGKRNITGYQNEYTGSVYYKINPGVEDKINKEYDERWFIYADDLSTDIDSLEQSMIDCCRKYGVKLFVLDNFMTIDIDTEKELAEQTRVIKQLIDFSKKYQVATILVCHPRKLPSGVSAGMYDLSGTSNIINLAHRTIGMRRVTAAEKAGWAKDSNLRHELRKYDVVLEILKDRIFGKADITLGVYYDFASRRFYTSPEEYNKQYSWDKNEYTDMLPLPYRGDPEEGEVFKPQTA